MFCTKCGANNPDDAVYCLKCGNMFEAEEETRVASRLGVPVVADDEERIFSITPTTKFVMLGYVITVIAAFLLVALISVFLPAVSPVIAVIVGLLLLVIPAYFHLKKKLVRYTLTDTTIEIDRGLVSRTTQNIPLRRVQDVTVSATLMQRLLGFGDITVDNASEDGGKVVLDNIDSPKKYADILLKQIRRIEK